MRHIIVCRIIAVDLTHLIGIQPSGRNQKLVVILSPVTHKMHIRNSLPSNRSSVFGDDYLKLPRSPSKKWERARKILRTPSMSEELSLFVVPPRFVHRWPSLWKIDLARLVDQKKARHRILIQANEMFMKRQQPSDVIANPVLPTAYFPQEIGPPRQGTKLKGKLPNVEPNIFRRVLECKQTSVIRNLAETASIAAFNRSRCRARIKVSLQVSDPLREDSHLLAKLVNVAADGDVLQSLFHPTHEQINLADPLPLGRLRGRTVLQVFPLLPRFRNGGLKRCGVPAAIPRLPDPTSLAPRARWR